MRLHLQSEKHTPRYARLVSFPVNGAVRWPIEQVQRSIVQPSLQRLRVNDSARVMASEDGPVQGGGL